MNIIRRPPSHYDDDVLILCTTPECHGKLTLDALEVKRELQVRGLPTRSSTPPSRCPSTRTTPSPAATATSTR